jgi:hypothetical protein
MRGTRAKALRKVAYHCTEITQNTVHIGLRRKDKKKITGQIILLPSCSRAQYQNLKKQYKAQAAKC